VSPATAFLPTKAATCTRRGCLTRAAAPACSIMRQKRHAKFCQYFGIALVILNEAPETHALCEWPFDDPAPRQGAKAALGLGKLAIPCYCGIGDAFSGITQIDPGTADSVVSEGRHGTCEALNAFRKTCACCPASPLQQQARSTSDHTSALTSDGCGFRQMLIQ
jgi:hypothetical protein